MIFPNWHKPYWKKSIQKINIIGFFQYHIDFFNPAQIEKINPEKPIFRGYQYFFHIDFFQHQDPQGVTGIVIRMFMISSQARSLLMASRSSKHGSHRFTQPSCASIGQRRSPSNYEDKFSAKILWSWRSPWSSHRRKEKGGWVNQCLGWFIASSLQARKLRRQGTSSRRGSLHL